MGKTENEETEFAKKFREWMVAAGYSDATAVSRKAGLEPSTLSRVLKGERGIEAASARKVANVLGVSQVEFFEAAGLLDANPFTFREMEIAPRDFDIKIILSWLSTAADSEHKTKYATISRIMSTIDELSDDDLTRLEFMVRGLVEGNRKQKTEGGVGLSGKLTTKLIKKGSP